MIISLLSIKKASQLNLIFSENQLRKLQKALQAAMDDGHKALHPFECLVELALQRCAEIKASVEEWDRKRLEQVLVRKSHSNATMVQKKRK